MRRRWELGFRCRLVLALVAAASGGCGRAEPTRAVASASAPSGPAPATTPSMAPSVAPSVASGAPQSAASAAPTPSARPVTTNVIEDKTDAGLRGVVQGELADVGPAGPATASSEGIVFVTRDDRVLVAAASHGAHPEKTRFSTIEAEPSALAPLGRGPGVAHGFAYWVSRGRLVRRALERDQELEVLTTDARQASRVTAAELAGKTAVTFLGHADAEGTSHARLWVEGGTLLDLTPDGAGASSVTLTRVGDHLLATSIDGRSAMTPMHTRRVDLGPRGAELGPDVVVWVGGPAQGWTETSVGAEGGRAWAHVPIERDVTHFGLATVDLGAEPHMDSDVAFFDYRNGLDLAPVASAELCHHEHVAYVRPTTSAPHSPAELVLVRVGTGAGAVIANARGFASVSLLALEGGGLLAYVADGRTWALGLGCH